MRDDEGRSPRCFGELKECVWKAWCMSDERERRSDALGRQLVKTKILTVDGIELVFQGAASKVNRKGASIRENTFKTGVQRIIREKGRFKDWSGETSDLYTSLPVAIHPQFGPGRIRPK